MPTMAIGNSDPKVSGLRVSGRTVLRRARAVPSAQSSGGSPSAEGLRVRVYPVWGRNGGGVHPWVSAAGGFDPARLPMRSRRSVSCRLEHGLGERSSGVSWVRSPSSVVRSHQLRAAGGDDRAGSREDRPRAPSQRFITEHLNRASIRASTVRERHAHERRGCVLHHSARSSLSPLLNQSAS